MYTIILHIGERADNFAYCAKPKTLHAELQQSIGTCDLDATCLGLHQNVGSIPYMRYRRHTLRI